MECLYVVLTLFNLKGQIYALHFLISKISFLKKLSENTESIQGYGFSSRHVWMWELDHKEGWASKNWCFWIVVSEKALESPLDCKEIMPVNPKWNQPWIFIGRTDGEAEASILWPPDVKSWLIGKDPEAEKDWRREEKGMTEDEMVGWHHWLNGHGFGQTLGDSERQGSLVCCGPRGWKELDLGEHPGNDHRVQRSERVL